MLAFRVLFFALCAASSEAGTAGFLQQAPDADPATAVSAKTMLSLIIGDIHKLADKEEERVRDDDSGAIVAKVESEEDAGDDQVEQDTSETADVNTNKTDDLPAAEKAPSNSSKDIAPGSADEVADDNSKAAAGSEKVPSQVTHVQTQVSVENKVSDNVVDDKISKVKAPEDKADKKDKTTGAVDGKVANGTVQSKSTDGVVKTSKKDPVAHVQTKVNLAREQANAAVVYYDEDDDAASESSAQDDAGQDIEDKEMEEEVQGNNEALVQTTNDDDDDAEVASPQDEADQDAEDREMEEEAANEESDESLLQTTSKDDDDDDSEESSAGEENEEEESGTDDATANSQPEDSDESLLQTKTKDDDDDDSEESSAGEENDEEESGTDDATANSQPEDSDESLLQTKTKDDDDDDDAEVASAQDEADQDAEDKEMEEEATSEDSDESLVQTASNVNGPVSKVFSMLADLQAKIIKQGAEAQKNL
jgi:hypothetical protein